MDRRDFMKSVGAVAMTGFTSTIAEAQKVYNSVAGDSRAIPVWTLDGSRYQDRFTE